MAKKRPKGFIQYHDRKSCDGCFFMKWVGNGSRNQQMTYCTKIEPRFIVMLDDVCDEFTPPPKYDCDDCSYYPCMTNMDKKKYGICGDHSERTIN